MPKEHRLRVLAKSFTGPTGPAKLVSAIEQLLETTENKYDIVAVDEVQLEYLVATFEDVPLFGRVRLRAEQPRKRIENGEKENNSTPAL